MVLVIRSFHIGNSCKKSIGENIDFFVRLTVLSDENKVSFGTYLKTYVTSVSYYHLRNEYSFDRHYTKDSYTYRVVTGNVKSGEVWVKVPAPLPEQLTADILEIEAPGSNDLV